MYAPVQRTSQLVVGDVLICWSHWVWCPGCKGLHMVRTPHPDGTNTGALWSWDGNTDAPTFEPSILVQGGSVPGYRCHSFLRAGVWEFLSDCSHELAGQRVPMVPLPDFLVPAD